MPHLIIPVNDKDHVLGSAHAPVNLIQYGDYQCPTCRLTVPIIKQLKKELGDPYCFVFRHFPLKQSHPNALMAAEAAEAAALQNKFWEMHDLLYKNQLVLSPELFIQLAENLQLDVEKFKTDLQSLGIAQTIEENFMTGVRSGVNGTPCFFINGDRYDGDPSF
jgi:protein-disulfide isomerase